MPIDEVIRTGTSTAIRQPISGGPDIIPYCGLSAVTGSPAASGLMSVVETVLRLNGGSCPRYIDLGVVIRRYENWWEFAALLDADYAASLRGDGMTDSMAQERSVPIIRAYLETILPSDHYSYDAQNEWQLAISQWFRLAQRLGLQAYDTVDRDRSPSVEFLLPDMVHERWRLRWRRRWMSMNARMNTEALLRVMVPSSSDWIGFECSASGQELWVSMSGFYIHCTTSAVLDWGHVMFNRSLLVSHLRSSRTQILRTCREYADTHYGFTIFGTYPRTSTERRSGLRSVDATFVLGNHTAQAWRSVVAATLRVIPRDWNTRDRDLQRDAVRREVEGAAQFRVPIVQQRPRRTTPWDWTSIPAQVAQIMEQDLTMHLEEPTEETR
jgi:hypothetical protein